MDTTTKFVYDAYVNSMLIQCGYEITDCNDEGLTDFGEACRIFSERDDVLPEDVANMEALKDLYELNFNREFDLP